MQKKHYRFDSFAEEVEALFLCINALSQRVNELRSIYEEEEHYWIKARKRPRTLKPLLEAMQIAEGDR